MNRLRVGLIGLGSVAQIVHLPVLRELSQHYEIVAGCDISLSLARAVAARHGIPKVYGSHQEMLAGEDLDVVAVLNSDEYHADCAIDALAAGCHVLIEKPVCLTPDDVNAIIAARDAAGKQVMVGYMRRHAEAYREMQRRLAGKTDIQHVSVRDIIGPNDYFIDQTVGVLLPDDLPSEAIADRKARAARQVSASIGQAPESHVSAFRLLSGLSSHDLSALRGLVGRPQQVLKATCKRNGRYITALLDYGDFIATFETGIDQVGRFDAYIEVFAGDERLRINYNTPYIRHLPTTLTRFGTKGEDLTETISRPTLRDPYTSQWISFHNCLAGSETITTTLEDAAEDVALAIAIVAAF